MKKLLIFTTLLFSMVFSSFSFGEWTIIAKSKSGNVFYLDLERMRINSGFRYVWRLVDLIEPDSSGSLSVKVYKKVECKEFKFKTLQYIFYKQPMGEGSGESSTSLDQNWKYPVPDSSDELLIEKVCEY